jgi:hypothetical protein
MQQLPLPDALGPSSLDDCITRTNDVLLMPEGLDTIPFTHGLHRFPGKFIPNIVRYIFRETLSEARDRVLHDPFCGSGTTLVEAALAGRPFVGTDLDPLAVLISQSKTDSLDMTQISELRAFWAEHDFNRPSPQLVPDIPNLNHWFSERAAAELSSIKKRCLELPPMLGRFSLVVLSSIIRRVSNADDQTQKTYVSHTLLKHPPLPSQLFPVFMERALRGMVSYTMALPKPLRGRVLLGDSRIAEATFDYDDVLTSPPYIDSIDYVYNQLLEYYWLMPELGFDSHLAVRAFRLQPMGATQHSPQNLKLLSAGESSLEIAQQLNSICDEIGKTSPKEERVVRSYFLDFSRHIDVVSGHQKVGGYYVCVIGNSFIRGRTVPTVDIISAMFKVHGYSLVDKYSYEIRRHYMKFPSRSNSGKIKVDHVLVFRRL